MGQIVEAITGMSLDEYVKKTYTIRWHELGRF